MASVKLNEVKELVQKEKEQIKAAGLKRIRYSKSLKDKVSKLAVTMSVKELSEQVGVSKAFIEAAKKNASNPRPQATPPVQLFDVTNSFMKSGAIKSLPIIKFTTTRGLLIEIFE